MAERRCQGPTCAVTWEGLTPPYSTIFARAPRLGWDSWGKGYESEVG